MIILTRPLTDDRGMTKPAQVCRMSKWVMSRPADRLRGGGTPRLTKPQARDRGGLKRREAVSRPKQVVGAIEEVQTSKGQID